MSTTSAEVCLIGCWRTQKKSAGDVCVCLDVFTLVKTFVADNDLSQPPLMVFPAEARDDALRALQKLADSEAPCNLSEMCHSGCTVPAHACLNQSGTAVYLGDDRKKDLVALADHLSAVYPQYSRGSRYLLQLAGRLAHPAGLPPKLPSLLCGASPMQRTRPILIQDEPHNVHRLRVKFHRYHQ